MALLVALRLIIATVLRYFPVPAEMVGAVLIYIFTGMTAEIAGSIGVKHFSLPFQYEQ